MSIVTLSRDVCQLLIHLADLTLDDRSKLQPITLSHHTHGIPLAKCTAQHLHRQRVLQFPLDSSLERSGATGLLPPTYSSLPRLLVMMITVLRKSTVRPCPSVRRRSSSICKRTLTRN